MRHIVYLIGILLIFSSCKTDITVPVPGFGETSIIEDTHLLSAEAKKRIEGVYRVTSGKALLGERVVIRWSGDHMSIFGTNNAVYCIMRGGSLESFIFFEGYWRYAANTETGLTEFKIAPGEGGDYIISGNGSSTQITLTGTYGNDYDLPNKTLIIEFERPIDPEILEKPFWIFAHRGGGRTADYLPASENTLEIINLAGRYGANAIEIDVKLSKDRIPFLYHDKTINLRLTQKGVIWGDIEDFTFAQLRTFITLINGEKIPSLREALEFVLTQTELTMVWLDMKSEKNDFPEVIPIQQDIMERAMTMGRTLEIFVGLPTDDKMNQFLSYSGYQEILSLNEQDIDDVRSTASTFWGPRWTLGLQLVNVDAMHAEDRRVITWTMDDPQFISRFLNEGRFDGMVTNYPTLVAYHHFIRESDAQNTP